VFNVSPSLKFLQAHVMERCYLLTCIYLPCVIVEFLYPCVIVEFLYHGVKVNFYTYGIYSVKVCVLFFF
jgi:hypothetical protein